MLLAEQTSTAKLTVFFLKFKKGARGLRVNWLCKHMKNVRSSQPCFSINFCTEFSKAQVFPLSILKQIFGSSASSLDDMCFFLLRDFVCIMAFFKLVVSGEETDKYSDDCITNLDSLIRKNYLNFSFITSIKRSYNLDSIFFPWLNTSLVLHDSASKSQGLIKSINKEILSRFENFF